MYALVNPLAPRSRAAALAKGGAFMVLIHLLNYLVTVAVRRVPYSVAHAALPRRRSESGPSRRHKQICGP